MSNLRWQHYQQQFLARPERERGIIIVATIILLAWFSYLLLIEPAIKQDDKKTQQWQASLTAFDAAVRQQQEIQQALGAREQSAITRDIAALKQQLDAIDKQLARYQQDFIPPERASEVLQALLSRHGDLKLVRLATLAPDILAMPAQYAGGQEIRFYQHGLELVLEGNFFALQGYVEQLKQMDVRVHIKGLKYEVVAHPNAQLTLTLTTVNANEAFIGL